MARSAEIRSERGQTLVELLVVMAMMGMVFAGITTIFVSGMRTQTTLTSQFNAIANLHVGVDRMLQDVDLACSTTATSGTTTNTITLAVGPCSSTSNVTWCTSGSGSNYSLYRYTSGSTCTNGVKLASDLTSGTIFTYYAANYSAGDYALPYLHVNLTVNVHPATSSTAYEDVDDLPFPNAAR